MRCCQVRNDMFGSQQKFPNKYNIEVRQRRPVFSYSKPAKMPDAIAHRG